MAVTEISRFRAAASNRHDRDEAAALAVLAAPFRRTALFAASGQSEALLPFIDMERDYGALRAEAVTAGRGIERDRLIRVSQALVWAEAAMVCALSFVALVLFSLAWYVRGKASDRALEPAAPKAIGGAASGADKELLWGENRTQGGDR